MVYIKNLEQEKVVKLAEELQVKKGQIISKTLVQNKAVSITLFAFSKGEEIGTHASNGDAMVSVLEGCGKFTVGGKDYICKSGESLIMPAQLPHSVYGQEDFKMLLTVIFPAEEQ